MLWQYKLTFHLARLIAMTMTAPLLQRLIFNV